MRYIELFRDIIVALYRLFDMVVLETLRPLFGKNRHYLVIDDSFFPGEWSYIETLPKPVLILQGCWPLVPMIFVGCGTIDKQELEAVGSAIEWSYMSRRVKSQRKQCAGLQTWLETGGAVNAITLTKIDDESFTPLMAAVFLNQEMVVQFLLARGADVHDRFPGNRTILSVAREQASHKIQRMLMQAGAVE